MAKKLTRRLQARCQAAHDGTQTDRRTLPEAATSNQLLGTELAPTHKSLIVGLFIAG